MFTKLKQIYKIQCLYLIFLLKKLNRDTEYQQILINCRCSTLLILATLIYETIIYET